MKFSQIKNVKFNENMSLLNERQEKYLLECEREHKVVSLN